MKECEVKILPIGVLSICFVLTGCGLSAPTYGTGKPVSTQFFEDVANITALTPTNNSSQLVMKHRSKLVIPQSSSRMVLPLPQQESSFNKTKASKQSLMLHKQVSPVYEQEQSPKSVSHLNEKQRQEYLRRQRERVGSANYRRYLTEPPLSYRQPARTAPVGQQGDEA
ncbi:hypothetical protein ABID23_000694 [Bartonella silvatica]|uniref:Lipoprotein n=1 Tax=Bartonella silvatica TaxID=357760 RepID=A0ABV2HGF6_9HYPH